MQNYVENEHEEYKRAKKRIPDDMWPTVSAFANTDGGTIHLGFTEDKSTIPSRIYPTGVEHPEEMVQKILNLNNDPNKISAPVIESKNVKVITIDNLKTIDIYVPKANFSDRPVYIKGDVKNTYWRDGEGDRRASESDLKAIIQSASLDDSYDTLDNFSMADLNLIDLQNYKVLYSQVNDEPEVISADNEQFLIDHGLVRIDRKDGKYKLSKAVLLLFGKYNSILDVYPSFMLDFIVKNKASDVDYLDRIYTSWGDENPDNIFSFFQKVMNKVDTLTPDTFELNGLTRKNWKNSFVRSVREAMVNCLTHADYHSHLAVQISWFDKRVVFQNPGELLVTKEEFFSKTDSKPRNALVFQAFVQARLGEHTGSGGYRILNAMSKLNTKHPDLEVTPQKTILTIWEIGDDTVLNDLPENEKVAYQVFMTKMSATFKEIAVNFSNEYECRKALKGLIDKGLVIQVGKGRATKYLISPKSSTAQKYMYNYAEMIKNVIS